MLLCTLSALSSLVELKERLEGDEIDLGNASAILNAVQNIAQQGAALSRYFWPMHNREPHLAGAKQLRIGLKVPDDGPLRDRTLRNQMESAHTYTDRGIFEVLGRRYEMQPIVDENRSCSRTPANVQGSGCPNP